MLLVVSVVVDTEHPDALAVYCNGRMVWPRTAWLRSAPCRGLDPSEFVPEPVTGHHIKPPETVVRLCPACPVRDDCEAYGRATRSLGWWGGVYLTEFRPKKVPLTWDQVTEIRRLHDEEGIGSRILSRRFNVDRTYVRGIISGEKRSRPPRSGATRFTATRKLTVENVAEMRRRHAAGGVTYRALAQEYGVDESHLRRVVLGIKH